MASKKTSSKGDKPLCTTKKQKFVGTQEFLNPATGELVPMQIVQVEDRDFNFHKFWLQNLAQSVDGIANQRLRLAFWIIENLDSENKLVMTQRQIAEASGMSLSTVKRTMAALLTGKPAFLQQINGAGAYRINPNVLWKGSFNKRMGVCYEWGATASQAAQKPQEATEAEEADQVQGEAAEAHAR